ncbi:hypothetical protein MC885_003510, partial [Smutsia gigantea]
SGEGRRRGTPPGSFDWRAPPCASRPRPAPASQSCARLSEGRSTCPSEPVAAAHGARGSGSCSAPAAAGLARQPRRRHNRAALAGAESARRESAARPSSVSAPDSLAGPAEGPRGGPRAPGPAGAGRGSRRRKHGLHPRTLEGAEGLQFSTLESAWGTLPCTLERRVRYENPE